MERKQSIYGTYIFLVIGGNVRGLGGVHGTVILICHGNIMEDCAVRKKI